MPRNTEAKCANCGGLHSANYRGCRSFSQSKGNTKGEERTPTIRRPTSLREEVVNYAQTVKQGQKKPPVKEAIKLIIAIPEKIGPFQINLAT